MSSLEPCTSIINANIGLTDENTSLYRKYNAQKDEIYKRFIDQMALVEAESSDMDKKNKLLETAKAIRDEYMEIKPPILELLYDDSCCYRNKQQLYDKSTQQCAGLGSILESGALNSEISLEKIKEFMDTEEEVTGLSYGNIALISAGVLAFIIFFSVGIYFLVKNAKK